MNSQNEANETFNVINISDPNAWNKTLKVDNLAINQMQNRITPFSYYSVFLGFAETFRTMRPPNIRLAIHCLKSILAMKMPDNLIARTYLQIGKMLLQYSRNDNEIKRYLEEARIRSSHLKSPDDVVNYEASDLLAEFLESRNKRDEAICVLKDAMRLSKANSYWHCRLLLKLASIYVSCRDVSSACEMLAIGSEYAKSSDSSEYRRGLLLLSKCMLLLSMGASDANNCLTVVGHLIQNFRGTEYQRHSLLIFQLILQVSQALLNGSPRSAKAPLKDLHKCIQSSPPATVAMRDTSAGHTASATNTVTPWANDEFRWLSREYTVVLVYLVTVQHCMQSGLMHRALRYADKATSQMDKLAAIDTATCPILVSFRLCVLEHSAMCHLVTGNKQNAIGDIGSAIRLCFSPSATHRLSKQQHYSLFIQKRLPQMHTLLGLYAMSMNSMGSAELQFKQCLELLAQPAAAPLDYLAVFTMLNLALVHLRQDPPGGPQQSSCLLERISTDGACILQRCVCLRAAHLYVHAFRCFCSRLYADSKNYLRALLRTTNQEDLTRLTAAGLMTLGQILMNGADPAVKHPASLDEAREVIQPVIALADRIPDIGIQLWLTALMKDLHQLAKDPHQENQWFQKHKSFSQNVISDHTAAIKHPDHQMIHWLEGPPPDTSLMQGSAVQSSQIDASSLIQSAQ